MKSRMLAGAFLAYLYNEWIGRVPSRFIRRSYLRLYLGALPQSTGVQLNCRFLNGRKVYFGENNVINFGCMFDGRKYEIRTGKNVSIGPDATILTLGHDPRSLVFEDKGGDVIIGDYVWIAYRAVVLPGVRIGEGVLLLFLMLSLGRFMEACQPAKWVKGPGILIIYSIFIRFCYR